MSNTTKKSLQDEIRSLNLRESTCKEVKKSVLSTIPDEMLRLRVRSLLLRDGRSSSFNAEDNSLVPHGLEKESMIKRNPNISNQLYSFRSLIGKQLPLHKEINKARLLESTLSTSDCNKISASAIIDLETCLNISSTDFKELKTLKSKKKLCKSENRSSFENKNSFAHKSYADMTDESTILPSKASIGYQSSTNTDGFQLQIYRSNIKVKPDVVNEKEFIVMSTKVGQEKQSTIIRPKTPLILNEVVSHSPIKRKLSINTLKSLQHQLLQTSPNPNSALALVTPGYNGQVVPSTSTENQASFSNDTNDEFHFIPIDHHNIERNYANSVPWNKPPKTIPPKTNFLLAWSEKEQYLRQNLLSSDGEHTLKAIDTVHLNHTKKLFEKYLDQIPTKSLVVKMQREKKQKITSTIQEQRKFYREKNVMASAAYAGPKAKIHF
jgi:hypothetical protein